MLDIVLPAAEDSGRAQGYSATNAARRKRDGSDSGAGVQTAQVAQSVLLPFLSALSEMDGRAARRRETEASQDAAEQGATPAGGVAEATAVLQADHEAADGSLERSTDSLRRQNVASLRREQAQPLAHSISGDGGASSKQSQTADSKPTGEPATKSRSSATGTGNDSQPDRQPAAAPRAAADQTQGPSQQPASQAAPPAAARPVQPPAAGAPLAAPAATSTPPLPAPQPSAGGSVAKAETSAVARIDASAVRGGPAGSQTSESGPKAIRTVDALHEPRRAADAARNTSATAKPSGGAATDKGKNDANITQILRAIHSRIHDKNANVQMRLDPPSLGQIRISMQLQDRDMALRIDTETHLAQRMLSEKAELLREALSASGIHLERIEVRTHPAESPATRQDAPFDPHPQEADQRGGGGRSEHARGDGSTNTGGPGGGDGGPDDWTSEPTPDWADGRAPGPIAERSLNVLA